MTTSRRGTVLGIAVSLPSLFILFMTLCGCRLLRAGSPANNHSGSIEVDGRTRTYFVHTPAGYTSKAPLPLVVVLHGGGGNAENAEKMSGMSLKADAEHFLVAYPNGSGVLGDRLLTWNSGNCCAYAMNHHVDDVGFLRALLEKLQRDYSVDPRRIYISGMSNGGMMAYRAACELSDKIAAIAPVAGALNTECRPAQPVSVIAFHGTADQNVPFDGGVGAKQFGPKRDDKSVAYSIGFWVKEDACSSTPQHTENAVLRTEIYSGCRNGTAVQLNAVIGQGHAWPGGNPGRSIADEPSHDVSATDLMWTFFQQHPKP